MNRAAEMNRMARRLAALGADVTHLQTEVSLPEPDAMDDEQLLRWTRALEGTIDTRSPLMSTAALGEEYGMVVSEIERRSLLPEETAERVGRMEALAGSLVVLPKTAAQEPWRFGEGEIAGIASGESREYEAEGIKFRVRYDDRQAHGDDGRPVPGHRKGEFTLFHPDGRSEEFEHGPVGSPYGNPGAKVWAARQVANRMSDHWGRARIERLMPRRNDG